VVHQQLEEGPLEELAVTVATELLLDPIDELHGKCVYRWVHVGEVPLVGGELPVGMEVVRTEQQVELLLREEWVDHRERQAVERQIPGRVPGVLPGVGHGDDVGVDHVVPGAVADLPGPASGTGVGIVLLQPPAEVVLVVLLRPQHPGQGLPHHRRSVLTDLGRGDRGVELRGLRTTGLEDAAEVDPEVVGVAFLG
jgi:hypothetical protein